MLAQKCFIIIGVWDILGGSCQCLSQGPKGEPVLSGPLQDCRLLKHFTVHTVCQQVTLARGVGNGSGQTGHAPAAQSYQGEESVGENTFGSTAVGDAGEGITSPGGYCIIARRSPTWTAAKAFTIDT